VIRAGKGRRTLPFGSPARTLDELDPRRNGSISKNPDRVNQPGFLALKKRQIEVTLINRSYRRHDPINVIDILNLDLLEAASCEILFNLRTSFINVTNFSSGAE
jgi:hypothetical protein